MRSSSSVTQRGHRRSASANTTITRRATTLGEKDFQNIKLGAPGVPTFTVVAVCRAGGQEESGSEVSSPTYDSEPSTSAPKPPSWSDITDRLVQFSVVPFLVLLAPQLLKNFAAISSGNAAALSILSWTGFCTGWLGNSLLLSYFLQDGEKSAVYVQAIGVVSNLVLLTQLKVAGFMPVWAWAAVAIISALSLGLAAMRTSLQKSAAGQAALVWFSRCLNLLGLAVVPQVLAWTLVSPTASLAPGVVALAVGLVAVWADAAGRMPDWGKRLWAKVSGCTATALFVLQPIAQLARNFAYPHSLIGISTTSVVLGLLGNALMIPRALYVRDYIWLFGSTWGCLVMGWGQLFSLKRGSEVVGTALVSDAVFYGVTISILAFLAFFLSKSRSWRK